MRAIGYVVASGFVLAALLQAIANQWTPDGLTLFLSVIGLAIAVSAWVCDVETITETHPDALGSLDLRERNGS